MLSTTVTVALQLWLLFMASFTVRVTVLSPKLVQLKDDLLSSYEVIPQLSVELLLISLTSKVAVPPALRTKVAFLQLATGFTLSITAVNAVLAVQPWLLIALTV